MTNTLSPGRVSILQWSILYDTTAAKLFLYFSHYFIHSPFSFSWHKLLKCGSLSVTLFWSLISATFGRFCAFFQLPKVAVKERRRKSNIFIGTQDFLTTLKQHSQSHTPIATQRAEERDGDTDRSGRFSCRSASFLGCLQGTAAGSPFLTWSRPPHRCRRSGRMGPRTTHPRSCCTGSS